MPSDSQLCIQIESCFWPEPVNVLAQTTFERGFVTVWAVGQETSQHYTTTLPASVWAVPECNPSQRGFQVRSQHFQLALEAERLCRAHTVDSLLAANNTCIYLLALQGEAVYDVLLPQTPIRHPSAHDAFRLMWWELPDGTLEFANVSAKFELEIY
jgi:hypothetical protein